MTPAPQPELEPVFQPLKIAGSNLADTWCCSHWCEDPGVEVKGRSLSMLRKALAYEHFTHGIRLAIDRPLVPPGVQRRSMLV